MFHVVYGRGYTHTSAVKRAACEIRLSCVFVCFLSDSERCQLGFVLCLGRSTRRFLHGGTRVRSSTLRFLPSLFFHT